MIDIMSKKSMIRISVETSIYRVLVRWNAGTYLVFIGVALHLLELAFAEKGSFLCLAPLIVIDEVCVICVPA